MTLLLLTAAPAQAADEHAFDPTLSLRGDCSTNELDNVPDPGLCPGTEGIDHPPKKFDQPCGTATDPHGDIYVASAAQGVSGAGKGGRIDVFNPQGEYLTQIKEEFQPCGLAVDSQGNVYVSEYLAGPSGGKEAVLFKAKAYPPAKGATYEARKVIHAYDPAKSDGGVCTVTWSVAVDPSNDHAYVGVSCDEIFEYDSAANGNALLKVHKTGVLGRPVGLAVYGKTHDIYLAGAKPGTEVADPANSRVFAIDGASDAIECEIDGTETPQGGFDWDTGFARIALDQSNGDLYVDDLTGEGGHEAIDQFDAECGEYIGQIEHGFKALSVAIGGAGLALDAPCLDALGEPCGGKAGYDSPNEGHLYVAQGKDSASFRVFAFGAVSSPSFALTVEKTGTGSGKVTSSPAGIDCGPTCKAEFEEGAKVTLTATQSEGSTFSGWSGAGCSGTGKCEVTMSEAKSVTAEFSSAAKPKFLLEVKAAGSGTGTVTSAPSGIDCGLDCSEEYEEGAKVTLTGAPGANTKAVSWSGCGSIDGENKCEVTMSAAKEVTATFALEQHTLSVSKTGTGTGKVSSSPTGIDCGGTCSAPFDHGAEVTLSQEADAGSLFSGWSGACSGTGTCKVTMSEAKSVTATFDEEEKPKGIPLKVAIEGTGTGTVTSSPGLISCNPFCEDEYPEGTKVTLTASPSPGSLFMAWKGCDAGAVNGRQCTVAMSKAKAVSAVFLTAHELTVSKAEGSGPGTVQVYGGLICSAGCTEATASFKEGTAVTVKQTPAKHFHFAGWAGDCTGTGACELPMGEDHEVSADFAEDPKFSLTLSKAGGGQALIKTKPAGVLCGYTCTDATASFYAGEVLTLTAKLNKGTTKLTWAKGAGTCTGFTEATESTCTVTITEATELKAKLE